MTLPVICMAAGSCCSSAGSGEERFTNRFHNHAFRYVRITEAVIHVARALPIIALDSAEASTFECSDPRPNALHNLTQYTLQCLTLRGYIVDCPHLERMGYDGNSNSNGNGFFQAPPEKKRFRRGNGSCRNDSGKD